MWIGNWLISGKKAKTGSWCHTQENGDKTTYITSLQIISRGDLRAFQVVLGPFLVSIGKAV